MLCICYCSSTLHSLYNNTIVDMCCIHISSPLKTKLPLYMLHVCSIHTSVCGKSSENKENRRYVIQKWFLFFFFWIWKLRAQLSFYIIPSKNYWYIENFCVWELNCVRLMNTTIYHPHLWRGNFIIQDELRWESMDSLYISKPK